MPDPAPRSQQHFEDLLAELDLNPIYTSGWGWLKGSSAGRGISSLRPEAIAEVAVLMVRRLSLLDPRLPDAFGGATGAILGQLINALGLASSSQQNANEMRLRVSVRRALTEILRLSPHFAEEQMI